MSSVLDLFLEGPWEDITEQQTAVQQSQGTGATRSAVLLMSGDVRQMVSFLPFFLYELYPLYPN